MPRHVNYVPHGVIPAVLLPFDNDLAILPAADERLLAAVSEDVRSPRAALHGRRLGLFILQDPLRSLLRMRERG